MKHGTFSSKIGMLAALLVMMVQSAGLAQPTSHRTTAAPIRTLLNEAGRFDVPLSSKQVAAWRQELTRRNLSSQNRARLHLFLGEWELGQHEEPQQAQTHFRLAQRYSHPSDTVYSIAAFDSALTLFREGAYESAARAFKNLMHSRSKARGYDGRTAALWYRHAGACAAYHANNRKAGIPQPPRLDPLCGVAGLAECLRTYGKPYDKKTLMRVCHVTGFGNSMADLAQAAAGFGLAAHTVSADEEGLGLLPKPLIAHVEGDHFVTVLDVSDKGIVYQCADCGPWPGGRVELTWKQWRRMNPGVYQVMVPKGSAFDTALSHLAVNSRGKRLSAPSSHLKTAGFGGVPQGKFVPPTSLLLAHIILFNDPGNFYCGYLPNGPRCNSDAECPKDPPDPDPDPNPNPDPDPNPTGPHCGEPVNLANGEEEYTPGTDLRVYNPLGPSVVWRRKYNSLRGSYNTLYDFDDFGNGWTLDYNVHLYVSGSQVILIFADGARYAFQASTVPNTTTPKVDCYCTTQGVPMYVQWEVTSQGYLFKVWHSDRSRWVFSSRTRSKDGNPCYSLEQIVNRTEQSLNFVYQGYGPASQNNSAGFPLLAAITDGSSQPLLKIDRTRDGKANIASVTDRYGRSIYYCFQQFRNQNVPNGYPQYQQELIEVSQIVLTGTFRPPFRYQYGYTGVSTGEGSETCAGLHTITVPSPTGTGVATLTINYNGYFIGNIVDANGNTRIYTSNQQHTVVTVKDPQGNVAYTYSVDFDGQSRETAHYVGTNNVRTRTIQYSSANQIRPDSVTDGNGRRTSYQWDPYGNLQVVTSPRGTSTVYSRNYGKFPLGELRKMQEVTANGVFKTPTTFTYYEPSGLVKTINTPLPGSTDGVSTVETFFIYDKYGDVLTITRPGNNAVSTMTTTFNYLFGEGSKFSGVGHPLTRTDNLGHSTQFRYDARGNLVRQTDALGYSTAYAYNIADQHIETDLPYDPNVNVQPTWRTVRTMGYLYPGGPELNVRTWQTPKNGGSATLFRQILYTYGAEGELKSVRGSTEPATYGYDALYRLKTLADGKNQTTTYIYNTEGYLANVRYPNGDIMQYPLYDAIGNLTRRIDGRGIVTNLVYNDPENQLTDVQYQDNAQFPNNHLLNVHLTYDDFGRRYSMLDGACFATYAYDDQDRCVQVSTAFKPHQILCLRPKSLVTIIIRMVHAAV